MSNITNDDPHLTIDNLKAETEYKFRITPISAGITSTTNTNDSSQLSLILDVTTLSATKEERQFNEIFIVLFKLLSFYYCFP